MKKSTTDPKLAPKNMQSTAATATVMPAGKRPDGSQKTEKVKNSAKTRAATGK